MEPAAPPPAPSGTSASPLIVALDFASAEPAIALVRRLKDVPVGMFKVGSELFTAAGPALIRRIGDEGYRVFLDLKFHDIPNTTAKAAAAAARLGVALLNVHAAGGMAMMRAAARGVREVSPSTRVIAVTLLTSLGREDLSRAGIGRPPQELVLMLAGMAAEAGLDGVVASAAEAAALRQRFPRPFLLVTPGIRPAWSAAGGGPQAASSASPSGPDSPASAGIPHISDDQKRVSTPAAALAAGADYIVVGRPITGAPDPAEAAARIFEEVRSFSRVF